MSRGSGEAIIDQRYDRRRDRLKTAKGDVDDPPKPWTLVGVAEAEVRRYAADGSIVPGPRPPAYSSQWGSLEVG